LNLVKKRSEDIFLATRKYTSCYNIKILHRLCEKYMLLSLKRKGIIMPALKETNSYKKMSKHRIKSECANSLLQYKQQKKYLVHIKFSVQLKAVTKVMHHGIDVVSY
jgi:hypothetical protein